MSADIVRRLMASAEDANDDLRSKSFHGTLDSDSTDQQASSQIDALTGATPGAVSGKALFADLSARAKQKEYVLGTLGADSTFLDYKSSMVGGSARDGNLRRELTISQRAERRAREERFGAAARNKQTTQDPRYKRNRSKRQQFNAGDTIDNTVPLADRQGFNASPDNSSRRIFREPPARGFDPFGN